MRNYLILILAACIAVPAFAQKDTTHTIKTNHYVGLQANQLLWQIFSRGDNLEPFSSPYLINYTVLTTKSLHGANFGLGYWLSGTENSNEDQQHKSESSDLSLRIGYEKRFLFGNRWQGGFGIDLLLEHGRTRTEGTSNHSETNKSISITNVKRRAVGGGPRVVLTYNITNRIMLGTEASYYFRTGTSKRQSEQHVTTLQWINGSEQPVTASDFDHAKDSFKRAWFQMPTVIWLIVKF